MAASATIDTEDYLYLQSERLSVQIALPGKHYAGPRFDWTGFITQVTLDGCHTFGIKESLTEGEGTNGEGLCNEFSSYKPIGYDEAKPGDLFPKLGVGLLTRCDDQPYSFFTSYPIASYPMNIIRDSQSQLTFIVKPTACNGYAAALEKTISVQDNKLTINYCLGNVGSNPIHTNEYCHNFVAIDGHRIGPGYRLRLPDSFDYALPELMVRTEDGQIRWPHVPETSFFSKTIGPFSAGLQWELYHEECHTGLRETVNFAPVHITLWGMGHVVSPEVFVGIDLEPGETMKWCRQYEFFTE